MQNKKIKREIGKRIEYIKNHKEMTNQEFAEYINTTTQQLSYVIRGERGFSITKLIEIAEVTGYPIEFILTGKISNIEHDVKEQIEIISKQIVEINNLLCNITALIK